MRAAAYPLEIYLDRASLNLRRKMLDSIKLLQSAERLAIRYSPNGFYLAFSGGKDSQALYHIAELAGVKFEANMSLTSVDPPELVRFIRRQYPEVTLLRPIVSMYDLIVKKRSLPTRIMRYCCAVLKETRGAGRVTLLGIRHAESSRRAKRNEVEVSGKKYSGDLDSFHDWQQAEIAKKMKREVKRLNQDQWSEDQQEQRIDCINGKDSIMISPIIRWSEAEVWEFLNNVMRVPHCQLYDQGAARIGCLFCPMAKERELAEHRRRYPKVELAYKRAIGRLLDEHPSYCNFFDQYTNGREDKIHHIFEWWLSKLSVGAYIARTWLQGTLFSEDELNKINPQQ